MANLTLSMGVPTGTLTAAFKDGAPDANGNATGNAVNTPATATWTSSDPTVMTVTSTGPKTATYQLLKGGSVLLTIAVPAAQDTVNAYSAFSCQKTAQLNLVSVTIQSLALTVA